MFKGMKAKIAGFGAVILVMSAILSGCGSTNQNFSNDKQVFRMNLTQDPPSLDPATANDNISFTVLWGAYEGLTKYAKDGSIVPGIAHNWDISNNQLIYTFHLRDAKWSNGDPVMARDYEYAWKRVLNPKTASNYAYILYYLKNAQAYNTGKITDADQVGVKALDNKTLQVTLERPTPYFHKLVSFITYMPIHQKTVSDNPNWAADPSTMITNGPFTISVWKHNDSLVLKKSPNYYNAVKTKFDEVYFTMIAEDSTMDYMFNAGDLDWEGAPTSTIPTDLLDQYKKDKSLHVKGQAVVSFYEFNVTQKPFNNMNIRKAFAMAIDRLLIVDKVAKGGQISAYGMVPPGIAGASGAFRTEYPDKHLFQEDVVQAKQLLARGMQEEGISELPEITILYSISQDNKKNAEVISDMWRKNLGVNVKLKNQELKVFLDSIMNLNYQIAQTGWGADYDDPNTFLDLFTSHNGNNSTGFNNAAYDKLISDASKETDLKKRDNLFAQAERLLIKDNMVVMPVYYNTAVWRQKDHVKNVTIDALGNIHFNEGSISK